MNFLTGFNIGIFALILTTAKSARILIIPNQSLSHVRYFSHVSEPLLARGHEVHALINGACDDSCSYLEKSGVNVIPYYTPERTCYTRDPNQGFSRSLIRGNSKAALLRLVMEQSRAFFIDGESIFSDVELFERLRRAEFDLCILDGFPLTMYNYIIPYKLAIPYVTLTTIYSPWWVGVPALPSFSPGQLNAYSDEMSFLERTDNMAGEIIGNHILYQFVGNRDSLVPRFAPERPPITMHSLQRGSKLWLLNTDPVLDYPRVALPHMINIGGLSTKPAIALPADLQHIVDNADNDIVIVSFGSLTKELPQYIIEKMLHTFRTLRHLTFIMKYNGRETHDIPRNVKMFKWIPQNDLLGQPAVKLFITHCGNNGQFEALYHGVPMLGLPLTGDQMYNAKRMDVKGFGIRMNTFSFSTLELESNILNILKNNSYSKSVKKGSTIFRSQLQNPRERATFWIEHILNHGSDHLVSHGTKLPWYRYWLLDVFLFMVIAIISTWNTILFLLWLVYRKYKSSRSKCKNL